MLRLYPLTLMSMMFFMFWLFRLYFLSSVIPRMMFGWFSSVSLVIMMNRGFVPRMCPFMRFADWCMLLSVVFISVLSSSLCILYCCIFPVSGNRYWGLSRFTELGVFSLLLLNRLSPTVHCLVR